MTGYNITVFEFFLSCVRLCYTKEMEGVKFAKRESRAECFADDTTVFIKRTEKNLRADFSKISGLQANLDKTIVIPLGGNFSINDEDQLCPDLKLVWVNTFILLGLDFDSKLETLCHNYETKRLVAEDLILKWKRRMLTTLGRISIAKALLLSQYVYCFTCIDAPDTMIKKIQEQLDKFIRGDTRRNWIGADLPYTTKEEDQASSDSQISLMQYKSPGSEDMDLELLTIGVT